MAICEAGASAIKSVKATKPRKPRKTKRELRVEKTLAAFPELLVTLDALAAIPPESCRCGLTTSHERCSKCGACSPREGHQTVLYSNYKPYAVHGCGECGAKANMYSAPLYTWEPRPCFAAKFARDMLHKMRVEGWPPSEKQVALADKLAREDHLRKPRVWERPAVTWLSPRSKKTWEPVIDLLARDCFALAPYANQCIEACRGYNVDFESRETLAIVKDVTVLVRQAASRVIEDRTGYAVLTSFDDYADALRAAAGDKLLEKTLHVLLELHTWLLREKRVLDDCPASLRDLKSAVSFGDVDARLVLEDAVSEGYGKERK